MCLGVRLYLKIQNQFLQFVVIISTSIDVDVYITSSLNHYLNFNLPFVIEHLHFAIQFLVVDLSCWESAGATLDQCCCYI